MSVIVSLAARSGAVSIEAVVNSAIPHRVRVRPESHTEATVWQGSGTDVLMGSLYNLDASEWRHADGFTIDVTVEHSVDGENWLESGYELSETEVINGVKKCLLTSPDAPPNGDFNGCFIAFIWYTSPRLDQGQSSIRFERP